MSRALHLAGMLVAALAPCVMAQDGATHTARRAHAGDVIHLVETGWVVAPAGDVDRDGHADFLVSDWDMDPNMFGFFSIPERNTVRLHSGKDGSVLLAIGGPGGFGEWMEVIGDLDGDGRRDVLISGATKGSGRGVAVFSLRTGDRIRDFPIEDVDIVRLGSDFDGDGIDDLGVLRHQTYEGRRAALILSGRSLRTIRTITDPHGHPSSMISLGDVDSGGAPDLVIAWAYGSHAPVPRPWDWDGYTLQLHSGEDGSVLRKSTTVRPARTLILSPRLAMLGDVDGDGAADYVVGDPMDEREGWDAGRLTVFSGRSGKPIYDRGPSDVWGRDHRSKGDRFANKVTAIGDFDGDRVPDLAATAEWGSSETTGTVAVFSGKDGTLLVRIEGDSHNPCTGEGVPLGLWLAGAGDVNGDGYADITFGENNDQHYAPSLHLVDRTFVIAGGPRADG